MTKQHQRHLRLPAALHPVRAGALYVLIILVIVFSVWLPDTFPHWITFTSLLTDNAVTGLLALGLLIPLAVGEFDLSVGYTLGLGSIFMASLLGEGWSFWPAAITAVALCGLVGLFNGFIVVKLGIHSFIATLAVGSVVQALIQVFSDGNVMTTGLDKVAWIVRNDVFGLSIPVLSMLVLALVLWVFLSLTPTGRRLHATGLGRPAARLAGIRTDRLRFTAFLSSSMVAGYAGIMVTAQIGAASPEVGPPYLIPAFAAAFLGMTQITPGLFNAPGTLLAVVLIGVLNIGLALAGVPTWVPFLSTGLVLILALATARYQGKTKKADAPATPDPEPVAAREPAGVSH